MSSKTNSPLISVIVPVFNQEEYLENAINSILNQTVCDWEMLLINDGSTDRSEEICSRYIQMDQRIHLLNTSHLGVSHARNEGIANCKGDWVIFLDSDDYYYPHAFDTLLHYTQHADHIVSSYFLTEKNKDVLLSATPKIFSSFDCSFTDNFDTLFYAGFYSHVWGRMYKRNTITAEFVANLPYGEDYLFNLSIMPNVNSICVLPDVLYAYRYRRYISAGQKLQLIQLEAEKMIVQKWIELLYPKYSSQLLTVFDHYVSFLIAFFQGVQHSSIPTAYKQLILSAYAESILIDDSRFDINKLTTPKRELWNYIKEKNIEALWKHIDQHQP